MKAKALVLAIMFGIVLYIQFCLDLKEVFKLSVDDSYKEAPSESTQF